MNRMLAVAGLLIAAISLSACTSSEAVLEPSAVAAQPPSGAAAAAADTAQTAPQSSATVGAPPGPVAAIRAGTRLQISPIVGATVETATPLTERLASRARQRGIALAGSSDPATTHVLKGYFSALTEGKQTTVIYVWDVYDPSGARLHRIKGQQTVQASAGEGWQSVTPATMQVIADETIDALAGWLTARAG